jgi:hypothetical protein
MEYRQMTAHLCMRSQRTFAIVFAAGVFAAACASKANPVAPTPTAPTASAGVVAGASTSGASFQLTATARMTDDTTRDVTGTATWSSSNSSLATVSSTGMVTVVGGGELDLRATYQNVTGSLHLLTATLPVVTVIVSGPSSSTSSFQLTAVARLSDGSTQDVTRAATWESSGPQWATVTATGFVTIVSAGEVDLRATYQNVVGSLHVVVSPPPVFLLSGVITDAAPNGLAIEGVRVQVFSGVTDHTVSDAQGRFAFRLPVGRAIVEVSKDGYQTWSTEIDFGGDTQLAVALSRTLQGGATGVSDTASRSDATWK